MILAYFLIWLLGYLITMVSLLYFRFNKEDPSLWFIAFFIWPLPLAVIVFLVVCTLFYNSVIYAFEALNNISN